jgi:hypothetical protein
MTRDEFTALPASMALGLLWDVAKLGDRLANVEAPKVPRPPKFDSAIYRRDGVQWASETDVEGLTFWRDKKRQSTDPKYAEKDAKAAKALDYWIQWRRVEPFTPWTGERNRESVTALPPCGKPNVYPRQGGPTAPKIETPAPDFDGGDGTGTDDDYGF